MNGAVWLAVGPVGALGALMRFSLDRAVTARTGGSLPFGTLTVNVLGSLLLGVLAGAHAGHDVRLVLGGAFLGSFTTFSTWMFETHRLAEDPGPRPAATNIAVSIVAGLAAAAVGWAIGGRV